MVNVNYGQCVGSGETLKEETKKSQLNLEVILGNKWIFKYEFEVIPVVLPFENCLVRR